MGHEYPTHPWPSCNALICQDDQVLLVRRSAEPFRGYWSLPGGKVELGETVLEALERECREETGLQIAAERLLGYRDAIERDDSGRIRFHYVIFYYQARIVGGSLQAESDAEALQWVPLQRVPELRVTDSVELALAWAHAKCCEEVS